ncbi:MAG: transporter substrate-binding domain-containing protein [Lentilitoribacter sp.]
MYKIMMALSCMLFFAGPLTAQNLTVSTVTRPPFSLENGGLDTGFSIDLWTAIAENLDTEFSIVRHDSFSEMLDAVMETGTSDAAIANISITSAREQAMDFSYPIFSSGLRTMIPLKENSSFSLIRTIATWELFFAIIGAFGVLLTVGMLMWRFERADQEYFDRPARHAMFPAFWWALNLVVNGGFEERVPRTPLGRVFGVLLVVSSLFVVSVFVARITSAMTVSAIESSVSSVNDLYGKRVGTVAGSTAEVFLQNRDLNAYALSDLNDVLRAFENGDTDAVVFDAPILAYYVLTDGAEFGELVGPTFQLESYGIALPSGSEWIEPINQSLLELREDGTYAELHRKWFGSSP